MAMVVLAVAAGCASHPPRGAAAAPTQRPPQPSRHVRAKVAVCPLRSISARVVRSVAQSSSDELIISIRNTQRTACTVRGYPRIRVLGLGSSPSVAGRRTVVRVHHGDTYFAADPGSKPLTLRPDATATFSVVTTTGFGHADAITAIRAALLQWRSGAGLMLRCHLAVSAPPGRVAQLWETALSA